MKYIIFLLAISILGCKGETKEIVTHPYTNELINESSPYLLQHAHNPVDWHAWNDKTLTKAKDENKLMLISIGYDACHWCHDMEKESFQDSLVAQTMNKNFINIKVDREERADVDQIYMNAVQLMTGSTGWPLHVIALPDGRPVWGGSYFNKEQWLAAINKISKLYNNNPKKLYALANKLEKGLKTIDLVDLNTEEPVFETSTIETIVQNWSNQFDYNEGGLRGTPKFMMPNNYLFLLRYAYQNNDEKIQDFVNLTLTKMAYGGIYDHLGGGFARYSTDSKWHIPHFEKMLYDNAQLVSLYSNAYLATKNDLYKNVVVETLDFINRDMTAENGSFFSSVDADSKTPQGILEEGFFYVWQKEKIKSILNDDFEMFSDYYNLNDYGLWENDNYVLIRKDNDSTLINKYEISQEALSQKAKNWKKILYDIRTNRSKPKLDNKSITSWNALMIKGYLDAYKVLDDRDYLYAAEKNALFIKYNQIRKDGGLNHSYKYGQSSINGYLEDYATTIDAFLSLYEATLNEKWLVTATELTDYTLEHFFNESNKMFYFTSNLESNLIARSIDYRDNVMPSSNSIMAKNLFKLSHYLDKEDFRNTAISILNNVKSEIPKMPSSYSNWLDLMMNYTHPFYEVAIVGDDAKEKLAELNKTYLPNKLIVGSTDENDMPLLLNRYISDQTLIYVCVNKVCNLPVSEVDEAIKMIQE